MSLETLNQNALCYLFNFFHSRDIANYSKLCKKTKQQTMDLMQPFYTQKRDKLINIFKGKEPCTENFKNLIYKNQKLVNLIGARGWKYLSSQNIEQAKIFLAQPLIFSLLVENSLLEQLAVENQAIATLLFEYYNQQLPEKTRNKIVAHLKNVNSTQYTK